MVTDPLGNTTVDREVRIVDSTPPAIVMNEGSQGVDFPNLQGGFGFEDPERWFLTTMTSKLRLKPKLFRLTGAEEEEMDFSTVEQLGFTTVGAH